MSLILACAFFCGGSLGTRLSEEAEKCCLCKHRLRGRGLATAGAEHKNLGFIRAERL